MTQTPTSPYKGLNAFEDSELDALLFFGRGREREIVVANLIASRLTVLYGPSGVGKSSLLRAAVGRSLRELAEEPIVITFSRWSDDPAAALLDTIADAQGRRPNGAGLAVALERAQEDRDVYLVLDQAEEYFLYHADDGGAGSFAEALPAVLAAPLRVNVLVSLREDSLAKLDRFTGRIPGLFANTLRLDRLDREAARAAIVQPLDRYERLTGNAASIEPALVEQVLEEVGAGRIESALGGLGTVEGDDRFALRIEAPYLQLVMQRLWEEERASGSNVLRAATLGRLGGAQHIVEEHLDGAMAELTEAQKDVAARLFNHLVTPSGTKIAHEVSDLADFGEAPLGVVRPVLTTLSVGRILRSVEEGDEIRYEIFHDVLAQPVLAWRAQHEAQRELEEERRRAERRQRRLIAIIALGVVLLAAMAGVTAYALTQRSEAREQAASAEASAADAERSATEAREQRARAERNAAAAREQRKLAEENESEAEQQAQLAEENEAEAQQQAALADQNAAAAQEQEERASASEEEAQDQREIAEQNETEAQEAAETAEVERNRARVRARRERASALSAQAETLIQSAPLRSVRLALAAAQLEPTAQAEDTLRRALVGSRVRAVLPGGGGSVTDASFSPNGRYVLTVAERARVFDARTGALVRALRDPASVAAADFSPDSRTVATAGRDGGVRLWPVSGGAARLLVGHAGAVRLLVGHTGAVHDVTYSQDGAYLVTGGADRRAILWNASTGARVASFAHDGPVFQVELNRGGTHLLTVSRVAATGRRIARLFEAPTGQPIRTFDQIGITTAIFAPNGSFAVTTSADDTARIWNLDARGAAEAILHHPDGNVVSAAFSTDGTRLVTATEGSSAVVWHVGTWQKEVGVIGPLNPNTGASFSPNRRHLVVASRDRNAHIFHADNGLRVAVLAGHSEGLTVATFSPDGRSLVTASEDGSARIWDPGTEDLLGVVGATTDALVRRVSLSPDGRFAISAEADGAARILDLRRGRQLDVLRHDKAVNDASFSPSGKLVLTASDDGTARLWRVGGEPVLTLPHGGRVLRATFSSDGTLVATAGDNHLVRLWRVRDGKPVRVLRGHAGAVLDVEFSPDGRFVASAGDNPDRTARIWRVDSKQTHVLPHGGPVVRLAFSPDSSLLATASGDEKARLWRVATGRLARTLRGHTQFVRDVDFRRDGRALVTASDDGDARTWDVATGATTHVLRGHFGPVLDASYSEDGRWVVTAGPRTAGIWDSGTGEFFAPTGLADPFLRGPLRGPVTTALFTPDGGRIVTASGDGTIRTFACASCGRLDALVRLAEARLAALERALSGAERRRYLRG